MKRLARGFASEAALLTRPKQDPVDVRIGSLARRTPNLDPHLFSGASGPLSQVAQN